VKEGQEVEVVDEEVQHDDPLQIIANVIGQPNLRHMCEVQMPYTKILLVGIKPDDSAEVSWSGAKAIEVTAMIVYACRTLFAHLTPETMERHFQAIVQEMAKFMDSKKEKKDGEGDEV
jgi:hypothetical protein